MSNPKRIKKMIKLIRLFTIAGAISIAATSSMASSQGYAGGLYGITHAYLTTDYAPGAPALAWNGVPTEFDKDGDTWSAVGQVKHRGAHTYSKVFLFKTIIRMDNFIKGQHQTGFVVEPSQGDWEYCPATDTNDIDPADSDLGEFQDTYVSGGMYITNVLQGNAYSTTTVEVEIVN